jgi:hypothetical protein
MKDSLRINVQQGSTKLFRSSTYEDLAFVDAYLIPKQSAANGLLQPSFASTVSFTWGNTTWGNTTWR